MMTEGNEIVFSAFRELDELDCIEGHMRGVVKVEQFSYDINYPRRISYLEDSTDYQNIGHDLAIYYNLSVFPNGSGGYVSIEFRNHSRVVPDPGVFDRRTRYHELTCVVEIIDIQGERRFPQSFVFCRDFTKSMPDQPECFVYNYISRDVLMREPTELIPNDILTLRVDIVLKKYREKNSLRAIDFSAVENSSFVKTEEHVGPDGPRTGHYLSLDSPVAKILAKESSYFERVSVTPMEEKSSGYVKIAEGEYSSLLGLANILWMQLLRYDTGLYFTLDDIIDMYVTADKYGIPTASDTCRRWLELVGRSNTAAVENLAQMYNADGFLRRISDALLKSEEEEDGLLSLPFTSDGSSADDEEWTFIPLPETDSSEIRFRFQLLSKRKDGSNEDTESERISYDSYIT